MPISSRNMAERLSMALIAGNASPVRPRVVR
jgi:hypothetical protein